VNYLSPQFYRERHRLLLTELKARDLEAVVLLNGDNVTYMSGFWLSSAFFGTWERPAFLVLTRDGEAAMILNNIFRNSIRTAIESRTCWVQDIRMYTEHSDTLLGGSSWAELIKTCLESKGVSGRVGIDLDPMALSPLLINATQGVEYAGISDLLRGMRYVKTGEELAIMRRAAELADWAQGVFLSNLKIGRSCPEVSYLTLAELGKKAAKTYPQDKLELKVFCCGGPDSLNIPNAGQYYGRELTPGDTVINIIICRMNGYAAEDERTFVMGQPSQEQADAFEAMRRANEAAAGACVHGTPICELDRRATEVFRQAGYAQFIQHRAGHGIGLGGHEYPTDTAFNPNPLVTGAVMSSEPGIYIPGVGGFRHSDTVVVGPVSPEVITRFPRDLESLVVK